MQKSTLLSLCCFLLWKTTVAQSPWTLVHTAQNNNYYNVFAIQPNQLVTTSEWGLLFQSNDGAQTMTPYQLQDNFSLLYNVDFLNPQVGYIGGGCYFPTDDCVDNILASTTDGGQTWDWERITIGFGALSDLQALPDETVYALSDFNGVFRRNPQAQSWDSLGHPANVQPNGYTAMQFFDADHGFVENWTYDNGQYTIHLFHTDNGGQNWTEVYNQISFDARTLHVFLDNLHGFQLSNNGQLGRSTDGGQQWTYELVFGPTEQLIQIDFVNAQVGYLSTWEQQAQIGRLYRTTDAGAHWSLDFQQDSTYLNDFHFADAQNGYAIGDFRKVYRRSGNVPVQTSYQAHQMQAAPNPATDRVAVRIPTIWNAKSLMVTDLTGREQGRFDVAPGQEQISLDVSNWTPGIYFLGADGVGGSKVKLLVLNR